MRTTLAAIAFLGMIGCGSDSTGPNASVTGRWTLQTIDNAQLPYSGVSNGALITITADVLVINSDGSYSDVTSYTITSGATLLNGSRTEQGNWQASNGSVSFYDATDGSTYFGQINGRTLTEVVGNDVQVYGR